MSMIRSIAAAVVIGAAPLTSLAVTPYIDFGVADPIAVGQPLVVFGLSPTPGGTPDGPVQVLINNFALVDTAAQGILIAQPGYEEPDPFFPILGVVNPDLYQVQKRGDGSVVEYAEQGVAGTELLNLFAPYYLQYYDTDGTAHETPSTVRAIGDDDVQLAYFGGIIGTTVLEGRVTVFANHQLIDQDPFFYGPTLGLLPDIPHVGVAFRDDLPADNGLAYNVCLEKIVIEPAGFQDPGDEANGWVPSFGSLYAVPDVRVAVDATPATGRWVVDTGAQLSIISSAMAQQLGIDLNAVTDTIQIGGLGGQTTDVPVVVVDEIAIPTKQGVDLIVRDVEVAVIDIEGLDFSGILGMNILSTGYLEPVFLDYFGEEGVNDFFFEGEAPDLSLISDYGAFLNVTMDLRDTSNAQMILEVYPELHHVVPEPATGLVIVIGVVALGRSRRRERVR